MATHLAEDMNTQRMNNTKAKAMSSTLPGPNGSSGSLPDDLKSLNLLRLQEIHILTGAKSSCVLFRKWESVECLFWVDIGEEERRSLIESTRKGEPPRGWEVVSESEGDRSIHLCLKDPARRELKMVKSYLIHWFAVQQFPQRRR